MSYILQCAASRQSLIPGTTGKLMFIRQHLYYYTLETTNGKFIPSVRPGAGVDGNWEPLSDYLDVIIGENNRHELINSQHNHLVLAELINDLAKNSPDIIFGENPYHELAFSMSDILQNLDLSKFDDLVKIYNKLIDFIHCGRIVHRQSHEDSMHFHPVQTSLISKSAYDYLQNLGETTPRFSKLETRQDFINRAIVNNTHSDNQILYYSIPRDIIRNITGVKLPLSTEIYQFFNHKYCTVETIEQICKTHLVNIINTAYVLRGMEELNITIEPSHYAGEDYDNDHGSHYFRFVGAMNVAAGKEFEKQFNE